MPLFTMFLALALQLQIPAPTGYVNDFAHVIDPASRSRMEAVINQVRSASGGEIVVVTLADLAGRAEIDVGRDIIREWKVGAAAGAGDPRRNTGVVLLLVPGARPGDGKAKLAIATGTGAEGFVTDAAAGRIRDAIARQSVAAGSYAAGLVAGVQLLGAAYAREFGFQLGGGEAAPPPPGQAPQNPPSRVGGGVLNLVFLVLLFAMLAGLGRRRRGGVGGLVQGMIIGSILGGGGRRGGWGGGGFGGGGFGGFGGGGGFGGFGGGGGASGGGASGGF